MKKLTIYLLILIVFVVGVLIYLDFQKPSVEEGQSKLKEVSLRLKWLDQAQFVGYYIANNQGLYEEKGLKVAIHPGGPDISPVQMVATGIDDFGITGADQIILARAKGIPLVAVAVLYKDSPVAIISLKDKGIESPKDLEGKTVAVVYGRDEEVIYRALLTKNGVNGKKIEEIPAVTDPSELISSGRTDARVGYELNEGILLSLKGFEVNLIKPRDYGINFYADTLFTTEETINNNPELVRDFVQASIEGWNRAINNQAQAIDEVMTINSTLDREHQSKFLEYSVPMITGKGEIGYSEKETWEQMQNMLLEQQILDKPVDLDNAFTNNFLD